MHDRQICDEDGASLTGAISGASVEVRDLSKVYGPVRAVDGVSFRVEPGEFLTLLGPSGSGKTTTLMMIAGFATVDAGDILIADKSVASRPAYARNLGFVFQHYALFPHMTVADNLAFPLRVRGMESGSIETRTRETLELVMLPDMERRMPAELSGGQQQRVALARALIFRPPVLLMDEPLGALDKKLRQQMQIEIKQIQRNLSVTVVYVTHDQEEALTMSDRVAVMDSGRIAQLASPEEIYERPSNSFVADFIGETNLLPGLVHDRDENSLVVETDSGITCRIGVRDLPARRGDRVRLAIRPEKLSVSDPEHLGAAPRETECSEVAGTLQDVIYLGSICKYVISIGGSHVTSQELMSGDRGRFRLGQPVLLTWRNADMRVLAA